MSGSHLSKDFFELVKSIGESKSKEEEDRIILTEVVWLKRHINDASSAAPNKKRQKEFLIRLLYVEMLGHDASFGYIKAVELTASTNLVQKRVGYLCCALVLSPEHEFRFMIINQLQRDLQSSNHLEVCAALMAIAKLVTAEMIPAVQPMITELLKHDVELVRKKSVMALHRFHQLNPEILMDLGNDIRRTLCDRDPSVMGAALNLLHDLAVKNPVEYKDLVPSFVSILKQITEHRLPREFDYHRIPAPWIQIKLLQILGVLGQADQQTSEGMYEVLHDVMRRADTGINVGYAIIYECVRTVTTIYPNNTLLDAAAASISRFISSDNHNLKYLGVTGLASIVKDHPRYATAHQMVVVDCLEDPDETLKRKTLDLLYRMTNPVNVDFITGKLTQFLRSTTDAFLREELVSRITQCAERYAPSNSWYIQTMTNVLELGGELIRPDVGHNLLRLIAEGSGEDDEEDMELRRDAVKTYLKLMDRATLPDILICIMAWILGEYGYLSTTMDLEEICERLCELAERPFQADVDTTRGFVLTAVAKIIAQMRRSIPSADNLFRKYSESRSTDLQQRCLEFITLVSKPDLMAAVLPIDASCDDIDVDENMDFLAAFVESAIAQGAQRYHPPDDSDDESDNRRRHAKDANSLKFQAYEKPEMPYNTASLPAQSGLDAGPGRWGSTGQYPMAPTTTPAAVGSGYPGGGYPGGGAGPGTNRPVKSVWGPLGFNASEKPHDAQRHSMPGAGGQIPGGGYGNPPGGVPGPFQQQQHQAYQQQHPGPYGASGYHPSPYTTTNHNPADPMAAASFHRTGNPGGEEGGMGDTVEMDERQKMASALFGGVPGASSSTSVGGGGKKGPGRAAAAAGGGGGGSSTGSQGVARRMSRKKLPLHEEGGVATATPVVAGFSHPAARTNMERPAAPPSQANVDLLDLMFDAPPAAATAAAAPSPPRYPVPQGALAVPAVGAAAVVDPFGMGSLTATLPATSGGSSGGGAGVGSTAGFVLDGRSLMPWKITTPEFGSTWGSCTVEKKIRVPNSSIRTLSDYSARVSSVNLHSVEAIAQTNEVIAAGCLAHTNAQCLVHAKLRSAGYLDVTVRTQDLRFSESFAAYLEAVLV